MCADKAKEKAANQPAAEESEQQSGDEFYVGGPKPETDAAGKLRKLFSSSGVKATGVKPGEPVKTEVKVTDSGVRVKQTGKGEPAGKVSSSGTKTVSKKSDPSTTNPRLAAMTEPKASESRISSVRLPQEVRRARRVAARNGKIYRGRAILRMVPASGHGDLKIAGTTDAIRTLRAVPRVHAVSAQRRAADSYLELGLKNFKGHVFLRKDVMQEFAYRITEVTKDWEDFRFVDQTDDLEWHRSSLNQALNDFASGLALPMIRFTLEEKGPSSSEPMYALGNGIINVRPDDIRNANNVDLGAIYHEMLHSEQDAAIIRLIALSATLNKPMALNSAEVMFEYCRETGLDPALVSRDWIHTVLLSSTDWLKRRSDEIKKILKKNPASSHDEAFARDRELVRAKELTESVRERVDLHKHLTRQHQLLVYMHREFAQNLEPHVYIHKFESDESFHSILFGYDWTHHSHDTDDSEFEKALESKPTFIDAVLYGKKDEWMDQLPPHYRSRSTDAITRLKINALRKAFRIEVADETNADAVRKFDERYRDCTRRMLEDIEDEYAEQVRLKQARHYLGVELELEANHASHQMNKLHGRDKAFTIAADRFEDTDDFLTGISELNEKLATRVDTVPQLPMEEDQAAVVVRTSFDRSTPDVTIAKNKRVTYRGHMWQVVDFNHDTGDVILHRSEERTVTLSDVYTGERQLSINETFKIRFDGRYEDGWVYRGKTESGGLRMFKPDAERIEVPKLALISVNQLLANARLAIESSSHLPRVENKAIETETAKPVGHEMSWAGSNLGEYLIEDLLSDRQFYWIYSGLDQSTFEKKVFKVAKPLEYINNPPKIDPLKSTVLKLSSVGFTPIVPNGGDLLKLQCDRMRGDKDRVMAVVEDVTCTQALCYARMEFIEGVTLRQLREHGPLSLDTAIEIVSALDIVQKNPSLRYHGDLTPDNIMISYSTVKLLDAGYFGILDGLDGMIEDAAVTTPAYYPFLTPSDMLALGIIFWELHFGKNPFASFEEMPVAAAGVSQALLRVLRGYSSIGRPFVNSMARLPLPRSIEPNIHPELERFLLASLGLRINEANELDAAARFESFSQFAEAVNNLSTFGITEL